MGNGTEDYKGIGHLTWLQLQTGVELNALLIKRVGPKSLFTSSRFYVPVF